jgi:hypothetical protein
LPLAKFIHADFDKILVHTLEDEIQIIRDMCQVEFRCKFRNLKVENMGNGKFKFEKLELKKKRSFWNMMCGSKGKHGSISQSVFLMDSGDRLKQYFEKAHYYH